MSFDKTPAKRYYLGKSVALCVAAVIILIIPSIFSNVDSFGRIFSYFLAGFIFLGAVYNLWRYRKSHTKSIVYENLAAAPSDLQLKYLKKIIIISYFAFPLLSIMTVWELKGLEAGQIETVRLWFPLAFIYEYFGYWPTVLSPLCLGIIVIIVLKWRINQLSVEIQSRRK